jgi:hypothetical protein
MPFTTSNELGRDFYTLLTLRKDNKSLSCMVSRVLPFYKDRLKWAKKTLTKRMKILLETRDEE